MNNTDLPWKTIVIMILLILATGLTALAASVRSIQNETLITRIRKE
jgi:hypothetical protein